MTLPVKPINEIEVKSEVSENDKILILDSETEEARLASKDELKGDKGDQGDPGTPGAPGADGQDGKDGKDGKDGVDGAAATISVGTTSTGAAGTSASVTNSGTSSAAVFDFTIPKGDKGDQGVPGQDGQDGQDGADGNGITSVISSKVGKTTTVTMNFDEGDPFSFQVQDGADGQGSGDVVGPASSTDGDIVLFDGVTGKLIKDGSKSLNDLVQTSGNQTINGTKTFGTSLVVPSKTAAATNDGTAIATEAQVKLVADDVATINGKIPSAATSSNQLADKNYVDDSINSVTAYYITKNAQGDQWATYAELAAASTFYSGGVARTPTRNDYTIVLADENHDNATTRYIYNSGWEYQYTVNETALTQAQLDALNSGITSGKVSTYDGYATTISGKQDALTLPATPTQGNLVVRGADKKTLADGGAIPTTPSKATSSALGTIKLGSDTVQSVSAEAVSGTANRTYAIQLNSSDQAVVNVPRTDTTYTTSTGLVPTTGTTNYVLTKTADGYGWAAASGGVTKSSIQVTLTTAGWSSNTQTVSATGVTASNDVIVSPAPANISDYADSGVYCYSQGNGTLTFKCDTVPSGSITVNVLIFN